VLPLGAIRPRGWLADQLRLQAENITGRLSGLWADVGDSSAWLGGDGEDWERGPYFADGLVPLAHVLGDHDLLAQAQRWVDSILSSQTESGQFGPTTNDDWWPRMIALKVLISHYSATGDERVIEFLTKYFRYQFTTLPDRPLRSWGAVRGADNMLAVLWLHSQVSLDWLLELADILSDQTEDWGRYLTSDLITGKAKVFDHRTHGPNVAMGLKADIVRYLRTRDGTLLDRSTAALRNLDRWHGQVHGFFSGDEWLAGREATQGVETCQVVEGMFSFETMLAITDDADYGDHLENLAFNLLPASSDPEMRAHQYHQQANQISASVAHREWSYSGDDANVFGFEPNFGCCTANLHQGWPKFVASLWIQDDDVLTAMSLAPCEVDWRGVSITVSGDYPFRDRVRLSVDSPEAAEFTLRVRIPGWSSAPRFRVDGQIVDAEHGSRYWSLTRTWSGPTTVEVDLGAEPRVERRDRQSVGVRWGALAMVLPLGETWDPVPGAPGLGEWWLRPRRSWNYGIVVDGALGVDAWHAAEKPIGTAPWALESAPVSIEVRVAHVPGWTSTAAEASLPPDSPVLDFSAMEHARLVPYGSARLRITEMPTIAWERKDLI
jgi:hypothetical protein